MTELKLQFALKSLRQVYKKEAIKRKTEDPYWRFYEFETFGHQLVVQINFDPQG